MAYCDWFEASELQRRYHDSWGTPLHDDRLLFDRLCQEVMQCGLSFGLVLRKLDVMRACFGGFDPAAVAAYGEDDVARIMSTEGMIRSERKIRAIINDARRCQEIQEEFGSFNRYLWGFTDGKTILYRGHEGGLIPASNHLSEKVSRDLKRRGLTFVGPTVIYSYLQSCGLINDHSASCPRRAELIARHPCVEKRRYGEKGLKQF